MDITTIIILAVCFGGSFAFMIWKNLQAKSIDVEKEIKHADEKLQQSLTTNYALI